VEQEPVHPGVNLIGLGEICRPLPIFRFHPLKIFRYSPKCLSVLCLQHRARWRRMSVRSSFAKPGFFGGPQETRLFVPPKLKVLATTSSNNPATPTSHLLHTRSEFLTLPSLCLESAHVELLFFLSHTLQNPSLDSPFLCKLTTVVEFFEACAPAQHIYGNNL
jgi:hypothetical protein